MKRLLKKYGIYLLLFIFIFLVYELFCYPITDGDPITLYGFSSALIKGEVLYRDFNLITTPFYILYSSLGLLIYNNYVMFLLEQTLLVTVMFYLLFKLYNKKAISILAVMSIFFFNSIRPTYNLMIFFLLILLLFLEEKHPNKDCLIGFCIGLTILTKQSVGIFFILPSIIIYLKDYHKLLKRFIGLIIPCSIFVVYLVVNKTLFRFIDLCFLGLFDFSKNNSHYFNIWFFLSIIVFIISLVVTTKNHKKISNYYLLCSFSLMIPLFDMFHFSIYFLTLIVILLPYLKINTKYLVFFSIIIITFFCTACFTFVYKRRPIFMKQKHFNYSLVLSEQYKEYKKDEQFINKYNNPIMIGDTFIKYKIINDKELDYFFIINYGNHGLNGTRKMFKEVDNIHQRFFIIDMTGYNYVDQNNYYQLNKELIKYIISSSNFVSSNNNLNVYYKE